MIQISRSFLLLLIFFFSIPLSGYGAIPAGVGKVDNLNTILAISNRVIPDYTLNVTPSTISVCAYSSAQFTIDIGSVEGFSNPVTLSVSNLPPGATFTFNPTPVAPGNSSILTLDNLEGGAGNTYTITITANSTTGAKEEMVDLTILAEPAPISLSSPANNELDVNLIPTLSWAADPSAIQYFIQVSTDAGFSNLIVNTDLISTSYNFSAELGQYTAYFWRVRGSSVDCDGAWSSTNKFTTVPCFFYENLTTYNIPDEGFTTSIITVPEYGTVTDVNVEPMYGLHPYISDLNFFVMGPNNVQVELFSGLCAGENDFSMALDDEATVSVADPAECGSLNGSNTYIPVGNLSDLDGQSINGDWILIVEDTHQGDVGQLDGWRVRLCPFGFSVLPIELVDFLVTPMENSIRLTWATAMEYDNAGFEIERRATHQETFTSIGWVAGHGEASQERIQYSFEDNKALPGVLYYYRLRQIDFDGKQSFSPVSTGILKGSSSFNIFPNPVSAVLNIDCINELQEETILRITDATGKTLGIQPMVDCHSKIDMTSFPAGIFFIHIDTPTEHFVQKIIK